MRQKFLFILILVLLAFALLYCAWLVLKSIYLMFVDARSNRELDLLARELAMKREEERRRAKSRLDTGCRHDFESPAAALPPKVCRHCGMAEAVPEGNCDHRWRPLPGIVPESECTLCGAHYTSAAEGESQWNSD